MWDDWDAIDHAQREADLRAAHNPDTQAAWQHRTDAYLRRLGVPVPETPTLTVVAPEPEPVLVAPLLPAPAPPRPIVDDATGRRLLARLYRELGMDTAPDHPAPDPETP